MATIENVSTFLKRVESNQKRYMEQKGITENICCTFSSNEDGTCSPCCEPSIIVKKSIVSELFVGLLELYVRVILDLPKELISAVDTQVKTCPPTGKTKLESAYVVPVALTSKRSKAGTVISN